MPQFFARVELKGNPGFNDYTKLHALMTSKRWYQTINDSVPLPHAVYQAVIGDPPTLPQIATAIKGWIENGGVWNRALVLVVQSADWAQSAG